MNDETAEDYFRIIKKLHDAGGSQRAIARCFGVSQMTICRILKLLNTPEGETFVSGLKNETQQNQHISAQA